MAKFMGFNVSYITFFFFGTLTHSTNIVAAIAVYVNDSFKT